MTTPLQQLVVDLTRKAAEAQARGDNATAYLLRKIRDDKAARLT